LVVRLEVESIGKARTWKFRGLYRWTSRDALAAEFLRSAPVSSNMTDQYAEQPYPTAQPH
jgi:hypothetical protein